MTTITQEATTITPDLVLGYEARTETTNVEHRLVGGGITISLGVELPREGDLELFFISREDAWAAHELHAAPGLFVLEDAELPELNMTYARRGSQSIRLDPRTRLRWILRVGFREVIE